MVCEMLEDNRIYSFVDMQVLIRQHSANILNIDRFFSVELMCLQNADSALQEALRRKL